MGKNDLGQLGDQGKENRIVPTEITFDFGNPSNYITRIETGNGHTIAVDNTGKVWTWGRNDLGQLGNGTRNNSNNLYRLIFLTAQRLLKSVSAKQQAMRLIGRTYLRMG